MVFPLLIHGKNGYQRLWCNTCVSVFLRIHIRIKMIYHIPDHY